VHLIPKKLSARGFTVLELLIATLVFSVILVVITAGVMSFTRQYYKGVVASKTQSTARAIMSEVTQSLQFGRTITTGLTNGSVKGFCVDNKLFSYVPGQQVEVNPVSAKHQGYHGLVVDGSAGTCSISSASQLSLPNSTALTDPANQRELLSDHMRISDLSVNPVPGIPGAYKVSVRVIYGDDDLLSSTTAWDTARCKGSTGSQFCSVSELTTTVQKRLQ
jgi:prepilin-type N-terminal cleavage/methylation domain-containing protein